MKPIYLPIIIPNSKNTQFSYIDTGTSIKTCTGALVTSQAVWELEKTGGFQGVHVVKIKDFSVSSYTGNLLDLRVPYTNNISTIFLWLERTSNNDWYICNSFNTFKLFIEQRVLDRNNKGKGNHRTDLAITMSSTALLLLGAKVECRVTEMAIANAFCQINPTITN